MASSESASPQFRDFCKSIEWPGSIPACTIGDVAPGGPDIFVIGDSHVHALAPGLLPQLENSSKTATVLYKAGLLPFLNARSFDGGTEAEANFDEGIRAIASSGTNRVIIHARFALHWLTDRPPNEGGLPKFVGYKELEAPSDAAASQANFLRGLEDTVRFFTNAGIDVTIIGALPHLGFDLPACYSRPAFVLSLEQIGKSCGGYTRQESIDRAEEVNSVLRSLAPGLGFAFLDPIPLLCGDETLPYCARTLENNLMFKDDDHLSPFGARYLVAALYQSLFPSGP